MRSLLWGFLRKLTVIKVYAMYLHFFIIDEAQGRHKHLCTCMSVCPRHASHYWICHDPIHFIPRDYTYSVSLNKWFTWWCHQMETFSALLAICVGNSPVISLHKGQWCGSLMFSLIGAWLNGWISNGEAGDLRHHHAHYGVTVIDLGMRYPKSPSSRYGSGHKSAAVLWPGFAINW